MFGMGPSPLFYIFLGALLLLAVRLAYLAMIRLFASRETRARSVPPWLISETLIIFVSVLAVAVVSYFFAGSGMF